MKVHSLDHTRRYGTDRWSAVCVCGWQSPELMTRRLAVAAHETHEQEAR